ncbi:MAG: hypothetical protein M1822_010041 [Bathelium mastoideum]|nr:MAG: hypothetical protein M1822_010041 [Bathelium mastoideum]
MSSSRTSQEGGFEESSLFVPLQRDLGEILNGTQAASRSQTSSPLDMHRGSTSAALDTQTAVPWNHGGMPTTGNAWAQTVNGHQPWTPSPNNVQANVGFAWDQQQLFPGHSSPNGSSRRAQNTPSPTTRGKAGFPEEELREPLPSNVAELKRAFKGIQDRHFGKRKCKGSKYLTNEQVERIKGIKAGTVQSANAAEKFSALHRYKIDPSGPRGYSLVKLVPPKGTKAAKDNYTESAGWVIPMEEWFVVAWEEHNGLHGGRAGRDETMERIRVRGYDTSIPKEVIQALIDRCPHPSCRKSSRLAKAQQEASLHRHSSPAGAPPRPNAGPKARRPHKEQVRSERAAAAEGPAAILDPRFHGGFPNSQPGQARSLSWPEQTAAAYRPKAVATWDQPENFSPAPGQATDPSLAVNTAFPTHMEGGMATEPMGAPLVSGGAPLDNTVAEDWQIPWDLWFKPGSFEDFPAAESPRVPPQNA